MDFKLTKEQLLVRKMVREFAENEVKPIAAEIDEEERFPMETVEKMAKLGMMGIYFPKEYGGAGGDVLSYAITVEELAKVCGTTAVIVSAHTSLCCAPIFENGTEEQKQKYLPDLCSGRKIGAFGLTEPKEKLAQSISIKQSHALIAKDGLVQDMGEHLSDELTLASALRIVRIINNQTDGTLMGCVGTAADLTHQLEVHGIQQFAPLNVTIIHKTIEHVLLTTEQTA